MRFITDDRPAEYNDKDIQPLQVIGAGVPRAATSSMQAAFEELGFNPCLHMAQVLPHVARERLMLAAIREQNTEKRHKLLHQLIKGHVAVTDLPVVFFTVDLMDMYPDAKVILNGRPSPEIWAKSAYESLGFFFSPWFKWVGYLWTNDRLWFEMNIEVRKHIKAKYNADNVFSAELYRAYYDEVRKEAKKRGIPVLEFKAEDGWKPLCEFVGKDVPDGPFPRVNEAKVFKIIKAVVITRGLLCWAALGVGTWYASKIIRGCL